MCRRGGTRDGCVTQGARGNSCMYAQTTTQAHAPVLASRSLRTSVSCKHISLHRHTRGASSLRCRTLRHPLPERSLVAYHLFADHSRHWPFSLPPTPFTHHTSTPHASCCSTCVSAYFATLPSARLLVAASPLRFRGAPSEVTPHAHGYLVQRRYRKFIGDRESATGCSHLHTHTHTMLLSLSPRRVHDVC